MMKILTLKTFWTLIIIFTCGLLVFYVIQVGSVAKDQYSIKTQIKELTRLTDANEALEADFSKSNSLNNLGNRLEALGFEKAKSIKYIQILGSQVVRR